MALSGSKKYAALVFGIILASSSMVWAGESKQEVAETSESEDGPEHGKINMFDASPVDVGGYEIETIYSYGSANRSWNNGGDAQTRGFSSQQLSSLSLTAGIVDNVDVSIVASHLWLQDKDNDYDDDGVSGPTASSGWGDINLSGRYRFFHDEKVALDVAYIGGFTIPIGTRNSDKEIGTSQEYWSLNQTIVASKDWGQWTANADVGFALPFGDRKNDARGAFNADAAGGYQVLPWLQPEVELNYAHNFVEAEIDSETLAITAGLVMPINGSLRINMGVQQGVWGRNADKATTASMAVKVSF